MTSGTTPFCRRLAFFAHAPSRGKPWQNAKQEILSAATKWKAQPFMAPIRSAKVSYEETENRGKTSAENLRVG